MEWKIEDKNCWICGSDENLTDQSFNRFENRANHCFRVRDKVEKETGERKGYFCNVTAETMEMLARAKLIHDLPYDATVNIY